MLTKGSTESPPIKTGETMFRIIEYLMEEDGAGVTEIAGQVGKAKSTVHDHLTTLRATGYVIKEDGEYNLSLRFLKLGEYVRTRKQLYTLVEEEVQDVAEETGLRARFTAREGNRGLALVTARGKKKHPHIGFTVGERLPLHATASGKVILAHLPESYVDDVLSGDLERRTENTITDPETLRAECETIRQRGYAFNREESFEGLNALSVPVFDADDTVVGGLCVSGSSNQLQGEWFKEELPQFLQGIANELKLTLMYRD